MYKNMIGGALGQFTGGAIGNTINFFVLGKSVQDISGNRVFAGMLADWVGGIAGGATSSIPAIGPIVGPAVSESISSYLKGKRCE